MRRPSPQMDSPTSLPRVRIACCARTFERESGVGERHRRRALTPRICPSQCRRPHLPSPIFSLPSSSHLSALLPATFFRSKRAGEAVSAGSQLTSRSIAGMGTTISNTLMVRFFLLYRMTAYFIIFNNAINDIIFRRGRVRR